MEDNQQKFTELQTLMDAYKPFLKVWEEVVIYTNNSFGYIEFFKPKGKNKFTSLIKEFPMEDIDRIVEHYKIKVSQLTKHNG